MSQESHYYDGGTAGFSSIGFVEELAEAGNRLNGLPHPYITQLYFRLEIQRGNRPLSPLSPRQPAITLYTSTILHTRNNLHLIESNQPTNQYVFGVWE